MNDFWFMLAGVVLGSVISVGISSYFASQGSAELRREAEDVKHYVDSLISYLEAAGMIRTPPPRDRRLAGRRSPRPSSFVSSRFLP